MNSAEIILNTDARDPPRDPVPRAKITWEKIRADYGRMPVSHCPHCGETRIVFGWGKRKCAHCFKEYVQEYEADEYLV